MQKASKKRGISLPAVLVAAAALLAMVSAMVLAVFADVPVFVKTQEEFAQIEETGMNKHYIVSRPLTLTNWKPVGSPDNPFTGKLEAYASITINSFDDDGSRPVGLVSVNKGKIKNINLKTSINHSLSASSFGVVAGENYGTIESINYYSGNCIISASSFSEVSCGGLCGVNYGTISKCNAMPNMALNAPQANVSVGGLCGINEGKISFSKALCKLNDIVCKKAEAGAVCGTMQSGASMENVYAEGSIGLSCTEQVLCGSAAGHLKEGTPLITNCYFGTIITVKTKADQISIGTAVGQTDIQDGCFLTNCVSSSVMVYKNISSSGTNNGVFFADSGEESHLSNCYYLQKSNIDGIYIYGIPATIGDLNLELLHWDGEIWSITEDSITLELNL